MSPAKLRTRLALDIGAAGTRLLTVVADDFANGRMILVNGWPVAESEAQLCALALAEHG